LIVERHVIASIDLRMFGQSALTDDAIAVPRAAYWTPPKFRDLCARAQYDFSLLRAGLGGSAGLRRHFHRRECLGLFRVPDCRPEFIAAFERMANLATKAGVEGATRIKIHTPLISLSKAGIVRLASELGVDFSLTHSCYDPDAAGRACGECDSCVLRRKGFAEAGINDPARCEIAEIFYSIQAKARWSACPRFLCGPAAAICAAPGATRRTHPGIQKAKTARSTKFWAMSAYPARHVVVTAENP